VINFLRWEVVSTSPNSQVGEPPLVGCPQLTSISEGRSSIHNLMTCHANISIIFNHYKGSHSTPHVCKLVTIQLLLRRTELNVFLQGWCLYRDSSFTLANLEEDFADFLTTSGQIPLRTTMRPPFLLHISFYQQIGLKFVEETSEMLHLEHGFVWCWNLDVSSSRSETPGKFWNVVMEKISWTDHVGNEEVLLRDSEQKNILHEIRKRKANWIGHIFVETAF
jgi:hypothetical protein